MIGINSRIMSGPFSFFRSKIDCIMQSDFLLPHCVHQGVHSQYIQERLIFELGCKKKLFLTFHRFAETKRKEFWLTVQRLYKDRASCEGSTRGSFEFYSLAASSFSESASTSFHSSALSYPPNITTRRQFSAHLNGNTVFSFLMKSRR